MDSILHEQPISVVPVFDGWIRDLGFNPLLDKYNRLVYWSDDKKLLSKIDVIGWNSLKKIYLLFLLLRKLINK